MGLICVIHHMFMEYSLNNITQLRPKEQHLNFSRPSDYSIHIIKLMQINRIKDSSVSHLLEFFLFPWCQENLQKYFNFKAFFLLMSIKVQGDHGFLSIHHKLYSFHTLNYICGCSMWLMAFQRRLIFSFSSFFYCIRTLGHLQQVLLQILIYFLPTVEFVYANLKVFPLDRW